MELPTKGINNKKSFYTEFRKIAAAGFSLIEILVALTLLGIAGAFVAGRIFDQLHEGRVRAAKIQMQSFQARLQDYRRRCGAYPTTDQGLEALISEPTSGRPCRSYPPNGFIEGGQLPDDPWGHPYIFESDGREFNIISYGADNAPGGEGQDRDIYLFDQDGEDHF